MNLFKKIIKKEEEERKGKNNFLCTYILIYDI